MKSRQSQQHDDEIDLAAIIRSIWDGKWIIGVVTSATFIITVIYLQVFPPTYTGTLEIFPVSAIEAFKYEELNSSTFINTDSKNTDSKNTDSKIIDAKKLELLFAEDLRRYKGFELSIKENMYIKKNENETESDFLGRVKRISRGFFLSKQENKRSNDIFEKQAKLVISFTTRQPDLVLKVISDALEFSNNNVNIQVQNKLDRMLSTHARMITKRIEDIDIRNEILQKNEKLKIQSRLAYLTEQADIAKALNIDKHKSILEFSEENPLLGTVNQKNPYYFRGFLSINKEIEIALARKTPNLFIPEFLANQHKRDVLVKDKTISRIKKLISLTPIGTDKFKSAFYDIDSIKLERKTKPVMILVLSLVLGGIIGILSLMIRDIILRKE